MRACWCCAGTERDGASLPKRKPYRERLVCDDCASLPEQTRRARVKARLAEIARRFPPAARARPHAARTRRAAAPQLDLVDLVMSVP